VFVLRTTWGRTPRNSWSGMERGRGVNGPCSRIPPLIKAPALIIVLDRRIALCFISPPPPRGAYLKSLKFFFLASYVRATIDEVKMFVLSKYDIIKVTTVSHRSLKRNVRPIRSRQVLRLHSLAKKARGESSTSSFIPHDTLRRHKRKHEPVSIYPLHSTLRQ